MKTHKKYVRIAFLFLLLPLVSSTNAQQILNWNLTPGTPHNNSSINGFNTFTDYHTVNWRRSHGTPDYDWTPGLAGIHMQVKDWGGEGIAGRYSFQKGHKYCITVGLSLKPVSSDCRLLVYAVKGLKQTDPPPPGPSGGTGLSAEAGFAQRQNIMDITSPGYVNTTTGWFTPTDNFDEIWVYPHLPESSQNYDNIAVIYVSIKTPCNNTPQTYCSNTVPSGDHFYSQIGAGTTVCSPPGAVNVNVNASTHTEFFPIYFGELKPNFQAAPGRGSTFLVDPAYCHCGPDDLTGGWDPGDDPSGGGGDPGKAAGNNIQPLGSLNEREHLTNRSDIGVEKFLVYPNPAKNNATIELMLTEASNVQVQILDAVGRVVQDVHNGRFEAGVHKLNISTSNLTAGLYNVRIQTDKGIHLERLSVMK